MNRELLDTLATEADEKAAAIEGKNAFAAAAKDLYRLIAELARASRDGTQP